MHRHIFVFCFVEVVVVALSYVGNCITNLTIFYPRPEWCCASVGLPLVVLRRDQT